jgi:hypothetical protein
MRRKRLTRRALKEGKPADYYLNPDAYSDTATEPIAVKVTASDVIAPKKKKTKKAPKK